MCVRALLVASVVEHATRFLCEYGVTFTMGDFETAHASLVSVADAQSCSKSMLTSQTMCPCTHCRTPRRLLTLRRWRITLYPRPLGAPFDWFYSLAPRGGE
jgi:hypothetical protein